MVETLAVGAPRSRVTSPAPRALRASRRSAGPRGPIAERGPLNATEPSREPAAPLDAPRVPPWAVLAAGVGGGLAIRLSMPEANLSVPALVAWAPALVLARRLPARRRFRLGWLLGFTTEVTLMWFIAGTMVRMTGLPFAAGAALAVAYGLWHGLLSGVFLWLAEPLREAAEARLPRSGLFAIAAAYAAIEWLWPQVFPLSIAHAFWEVGPVISLTALVGVPGLAFLVLLVNAVVAEGWVTRSARRVVPGVIAVAALLAAGLGWHLYVAGVAPYRTLRVAIVQPNYTVAEKQRAASRRDTRAAAAQREAFLERLTAAIEALPPRTYDLVVASEGAFPYSWRVDADRFPDGAPMPTTVRATKRLQAAIARGPATDAIIGGLRLGPSERVRNAAVHLGADGGIRAYYDKQVLMPFGETMPLSDVFPSLVGAIPGISDFEAGDAACAFAVGDVSVACGICYETCFSLPTRTDLGSAALLVNLTIDTWFGTTNAPESHLMLQAPRAAELGVPLVRAALSGISAVVEPTGDVVATLPLDTAGVLDVNVPLRDVTTPWRAIGPVVPWLFVAVTALLLADVVVRRRRRRRADAAPPPTPGPA